MAKKCRSCGQSLSKEEEAWGEEISRKILALLRKRASSDLCRDLRKANPEFRVSDFHILSNALKLIDVGRVSFDSKGTYRYIRRSRLPRPS